MANQLSAGIERIKKLDNPLLVIGLGGTGAGAVKTIKSVFQERFELPKLNNGQFDTKPERTEYWVLDTANVTGTGFEQGEFTSISVPGINNILDPNKRDANLKDYERSWIHESLSSAHSGMGAGTVRQASRLMFFRKFQEIKDTLVTKLERISSVRRGNMNNTTADRIEVVIVTGICGGTGSGTFLDMAMLLRHLCATDPAISTKQVHVTGYIVMPDVTIKNNTGSPALEQQWMANGFAALKELDFWMRVADHGTHYAQQYDPTTIIEWNMPPFDQCVLLSGTTMDGNTLDAPMDACYDVMAESLLHYLANENTGKTNGRPSFIEHEDNTARGIRNLAKTKPAAYCYRAIGAYSKSLPRDQVLSYEGDLLLSEFIPPVDQYNIPKLYLPIFDQAVMDEEALAIAGKVNALYQNEGKQIKFPDFVTFDPNDSAKMASLRGMSNVPPHQHLESGTQWQLKVAAPGARQMADLYLNAAWERFCIFAKRVMLNKKEGPFALEEYIKRENGGLLYQLEQTLDKWKSGAQTARNGIAGQEAAAEELHKKFMRPTLLERGQTVLNVGTTVEVQYTEALKTLFDQARKAEYFQAHANALQSLIDFIKSYQENSLSPMLQALRDLSAEFKNTVSTPAEAQLITLDSMRDTLDASYQATNQNDAVINQLLSYMATTGLAFKDDLTQEDKVLWSINKENAASVIVDQIRVCMKSTLGGLDIDSADSMMLQACGADATAQNLYMQNLTKQLYNNARPIFLQDNAFANEDSVDWIFMSIPKNAQKHLTDIPKLLSSRLTPKESDIKDHIYALNSLDGLPLYRYGMLVSLEQAYENYIQVGNDIDVHLVMRNNHWNENDVSRNWTRLPSPRPYYLFNDAAGNVARTNFEYARKLLNRALDCDMVKIIDSLNGQIGYEIRVLWANGGIEQMEPNATLIERAKKIEEYPLNQRAKHYEKLFADGNRAPIKGLMRDTTSEFKVMLGLRDEDCNPNDPDVKINPQRLEKAKENHYRLAIEAVASTLAMRPYDLARIEQQIEAHEYIHPRYVYAKDHEGEEDQMWKVAQDIKADVAEMVIYGVLTQTMSGYVYKQVEGTAHVLDLAMDEAVYKACPMPVLMVLAIARMDKKNPVRGLLFDQLVKVKDPNVQLALPPEQKAAYKQNGTLFKQLVDKALELLQYNTPSVLREEKNEAILQGCMDLLNGMKAQVDMALMFG